MIASLKVALIQMVSGEDVQANLHTAETLIAQASTQGARIVLLPEYFYFMGSLKNLAQMSEPLGNGPIQTRLAQIAKNRGIFLLAGSLPLKVNSETKVGSGSVLFSSEGKVIARYDKRHLFNHVTPGSNERHCESDYFIPGDQLEVVEVDDVKLGLSICYDVRFPEHFRELSALGAEIITVPSAFTEATGKAHWHTLLRARAIENQCFILAPNQAGAHPNGNRTYGHSLIIDPWGETLAEGPSSGSFVVSATLDLERLRKLRLDFQVLADRLDSRSK